MTHPEETEDGQAEEQVETMPRATESEARLVGAAMLSRDAGLEVLELVRPEDLYSARNQVTLEAIRTILARPEGVADLVTVTDELEATGMLAKAGGVPALLALCDGLATAATSKWHAGKVREAASRRRMVLAAKRLERGARDATSPEAVALEAESEIREAVKPMTSPELELEPLKPAVVEAFERLDRCYESGEPEKGLETGLLDLDRLTGGMRPGDLVILGARPSVGKSALALGVGLHLIRNKTPIHLESLEMSRRQVANRLISQVSGVSSSKLRDADVDDDDWGEIAKAISLLESSPMSACYQRGRRLSQIRTTAMRARETAGIALLVIDYLGLIRPDRELESRRHEVEAVSMGLKDLAVDLGIPVLALAQISRKSEDRGSGDREPRISDLRETGQIEADADQIWLLHRATIEEKGEDGEFKLDPRNAKLIVGKNRDGETGAVRLYYRSHLTQFTNHGSE